MKRTIANQLAMVNWRGVFYERYLLDRGVTALEGVNGVGKTTVMVAAYVVLLPDQRYLHFEPLAEAGVRAEDRGIWGRLGEGDDAYSAIDFRLGSGERLVAGVRLERKSKENGELHPFLVRGLPVDATLQQVLLDRSDGHDEVPAPDRLAQLAAVAGGRLTWCDSVTSYLRDLFDAGVTPMPLSTDAERAKLNELLKTSMMGGISRQLGDGLRGFLLRPEEGLGATLHRIRGNLDDCRRTRMQVTESRQIEQEVHDVLDAGAHMFAAAVEGARRFAEERQRQADDARALEGKAVQARDALNAKVATETIALHRAEAEEAAATEEAKAARETATRVARAHQIWTERGQEEQRRAEAILRLSEARVLHAAADSRLRDAEATVRGREQDHQAAARGMADIQQGLERLHARASRYRTVKAALGRARAMLPGIDFSDGEAGAMLARCVEEASKASADLVDAQGRLDTADASAKDFLEAHALVERLVGHTIAHADSCARALHMLAELREQQVQVERLPRLRKERQEAAGLARRQDIARRSATELSLQGDAITSSGDVLHARQGCIGDLESASAALAEAGNRARDLAREAEAQQRLVQALQARLGDIQQLRGAIGPLAARREQSVTSSSEVALLVAWLQAEHARGQQLATTLAGEVEVAEARLQELRRGGGAFPEYLVQACEAVEGRLLVERFEDVPFDRAAEVEARLGPLVHAVLVDDPDGAAQVLVRGGPRPPSLLLLNGPQLNLSPSQLPTAERAGDSILAPIPTGLRLTRLPGAPVVGRQARERLIRSLEADLRSSEARLADARAAVRELDSDVRVVTAVLPNASLLDVVDPEGDLREASTKHATLEAAKKAADEDVRALEARVGQLRTRKAALEQLWPDAALLDPPDHAARGAALDAEITAAAKAQRHLETVREARRKLEQRLDVLRVLPLDAAARTALAARVTAAELARKGWLAPQPDLTTAHNDVEALGFSDAEARIRADETLLASLNTEVETAEERLNAARAARDEEKAAEASASTSLRNAAASAQVADERLAGFERDLAATGVDDASDEALALAREEESRASSYLLLAAGATRRAGEVVAGLTPQVASAAKEAELAKKDREDKEAQSGPAVERWGSLRRRCQDLGLLDAALADSALAEVAGKASVDVFQLRDRWWALVLDRLGHATGGASLTAALRLIEAAPSEAGGEQYLRAWMETRAWLAQRVPKHVSEVDDPVDALRRLRHYLDGLVEKLARHEHRLRGDSKDVARAIEGRLRKVNNLLTKLNRDLRGVGFGSIEAIQVRSEREVRMDSVLTALASPEEQQRLFGPDMTIEEALNELFARHGGRRDGGARILDYREYLRLKIEVRRRGSETWDEARGNQMSTGEAIGVGAAIMMVVLTAWERDAGLLRARREAGTLRFLFLDEATRLSLDNLGVLFDLCSALDLQLLVAAPEVATSTGNTTYLLQTVTDPDGREVVKVSGRRAVRGQA